MPAPVGITGIALGGEGDGNKANPKETPPHQDMFKGLQSLDVLPNRAPLPIYRSQAEVGVALIFCYYYLSY